MKDLFNKLTSSGPRILLLIIVFIIVPLLFLFGHCSVEEKERRDQQWLQEEYPEQYQKAQQIIEEEYNDEGRVTWGTGRSMLPVMSYRSVAIVIPVDFEDVEPGDIIETKPDGLEQRVHHMVVRRTDRGLQTKGINNDEIDHWFTTHNNYYGKVIIVE